MNKTLYYKISDIDLAVNFILNNINSKYLLFNGPMGSGKTTLIKAIVRKLGCDDSVSSPSFSLVNEYEIKDSVVYHFDFYRIKNEIEAFDIGFEDYLREDVWCFIEWGENIPNLIPNNVNLINFTEINGDSRIIEINLNE